MLQTHSPSENPYHRAFERLSKAASVFGMLVGGLVLIGWLTGNDALTRVLPGSIVVKANTGVALVLSGVALWLLHQKSPRRWVSMLRLVCSSLVTLAGLLTLSEYVFGWDLGIDQLLITETLVHGGEYPGRMAPATALNCLLLGTSLLLRADARKARLAQNLTVPSLALTLIAIIGYVYGAESFFRIGAYTSIALPTAITFFILGTGLIFVRPAEGGMPALVSQGASGMLARYLLPLTIVVPIALGSVHKRVVSAGWFDELVVEAVTGTAQVLILAGAASWIIITLHRVDLERQRAGDEVRRLNMELEDRVRKRTEELGQANERLEAERDQLQVLMDNIPDSIYFKDAASRFTRINAAQARTLGLEDPRQAIGKTDADFFAPEAAAAAYTDERQLIETGESIIDRQEYSPTTDGRSRWFESTKVPFRDHRGRIAGLVGISRNITSRAMDQKALADEKARLSERVLLMTLIIELDEQLQACTSDQEVYQVAARLVSRMFPGELGALYSVDPAQDSVKTAVTWGEPPLEAQTFELDDCWALRRGKPHYWGGENMGELCPHLEGKPPAFSVCLPLLAVGERLGILHLRSAPGVESPGFGEIQMQSAHLTADSLALAWANVRLRESLHEQAVRDPLTGLYNRRHMQASLERDLRRAARNTTPLGVIMLDIDYFKEINDTHGHDAGDLVLREVGHFLKERTREGDTPCRLGGEEFLIILPDATLEQTMARALKHRQNFSAVQILYAGGPIETPTLSMGVAAYPKHGTSAEELLRAADLALYAAKQAGRDRVVAAE